MKKLMLFFTLPFLFSANAQAQTANPSSVQQSNDGQSSDCYELSVYMTSLAKDFGALLESTAMNSSTAISNYKDRATGHGPGRIAQHNYHAYLYNANLGFRQSVQKVNAELMNKIEENAHCFEGRDLVDILKDQY